MRRRPMAELAKLIDYTVCYQRYIARCRRGHSGEACCITRQGMLWYVFDIRA